MLSAPETLARFTKAEKSGFAKGTRTGPAEFGIITAFHCDYTHDSAVNKAFVGAYNAESGRTSTKALCSCHPLLPFLPHQPAAFTFPGSLFLCLPLVVELLAARQC